MNTAENRFIPTLRIFSLYGIAATLAFSKLNLNSVFIMLLFLTWLIEGDMRNKWQVLKKDLVFLAYLLYYVVLLVGMTSAPSLKAAWHGTETTIGFIVLPLILCSRPTTSKERARTMFAFITFLTLASAYCIIHRLVDFSKTGETQIFFYHELLKPIGHHAIYFSGFVFIGIIYLLEPSGKFDLLRTNRWIRIVWIAYFVGLLVLLSSKMVLVLLLIYAIYLLRPGGFLRIKIWQKWGIAVSVAAIIILLFTVNNPVRQRFDDAMRRNTELEKDRFSPSTYFNGVEFRVLLWRITYEVINEQHAWIFGVGPTNAQQYIDQKYLQLNLYAGNPGEAHGGYLVYNCHNQFLQTALESGLIGVIVLLFVYTVLLAKAIQSRNELIIWTMIFIFCFFFIESVLERQYGMLLFTWLVVLNIKTEKTSPRLIV